MDPFELNLRHLRALGAIIRLRSMRAAADEVGMSQPALTQGLAKLEQRLGVVLFDRRSDGVEPTEAGRIVAGRAASAFAHLAKAAKGDMRTSARGFSHPEWLMTGTQLRAFLAVADHGGFAGAARATGMAPPSLHRAVRDLEQIGRMSLLENHGRGVQLSPAGRRRARGVRLAASEIAAAIAEAAGDDGGLDGGIVLGAMPLARARVLPAAIATFLNGTPRCDIRIVEGSWRELVEPLHDGIIDFMIGALRDELPADLEQRPLFEDGLVVVGRAAHPLAGRTPTIADLRRFEWVLPSAGTPLRAQWTALFEGGDPPATPVECGSIMVIRGILAGTDLLTLLSPDQVSVETEAGLLTQIGQPIARGVRAIGVTSRRGWRPRAIQRRFLDALDRAAQSTIRENL